jgi:hypothetical protein
VGRASHVLRCRKSRRLVSFQESTYGGNDSIVGIVLLVELADVCSENILQKISKCIMLMVKHELTTYLVVSQDLSREAVLFQLVSELLP